MSAATSTAPAAYEAWGVEGRKPALLGVGATKGDCDRIHRHHEGGGITVRGGVVIAVKTGTVTSAKASLQHAAFAAYRERGDLPAPTETDRQRERVERAEAERERQRAALRLVAPLPEERADEADDESDEADDAPARAADDCDEPEDDEDDEWCAVHGCREGDCDDTDQDDTDDTSEDTVDRSASTSTTAAPETAPTVPASAPAGACPCGEPSAVARSKTAPELRDLCKVHRKRAIDLLSKFSEYTPALVRERVLAGKRPASMPSVPTLAERGARGGKARTKTLRPAVAETVRRVPAAPTTKPQARRAPRATQPPAGYINAVDTIRRLAAVRDQLGGVEAVERAAALVVAVGGVDALASLLEAVRGSAG